MIKRPDIKTRADIEEAQTGRTLTPEQRDKQRADRLKLELQTSGIANRLERVGIKTKADKFAVLGLYSHQIEEKTQYVNSNMLPEVMARNTHNMLQAVQFYLDEVGQGLTRMWVFSWGWVEPYDYSTAHKAFTRWISKFSKSELIKKMGLEFVYYSVENTVQRDASGTLFLNLHAHVLVQPKRYIPKKDWHVLCEMVRHYAPKNYFNDSRIEKAAEVVKYVFKPAEFETITDDELGSIFLATASRRFHTPLGTLKEFRAGLNNDGLRLKRIEIKNRPQWVLVKKNKRDSLDKTTIGDVPNNIPVGVTSPAPVFSEVYEPCLIIQRFDGNIEGMLAMNPWIEQRMASIRRTVERRQSLIIKDTTTISVREASHNKGSFEPPEIPPDENWELEPFNDRIERLDYSTTDWF